MGVIKEENTKYPESVRQIEPGDSVIGGPNGPINLCLKDLTDRTGFLKKSLGEAVTDLNEKKADKGTTLLAYGITDAVKTTQVSQKTNGTSKTNVASEDALRQVNTKVDGIIIPIGSTAEAGIVKLVTATNSTSTTDAATPSAVKAAMDKANSATTLANGKAAKATTLAGYGITDGVKTTQISQSITGTSKTNVASEDALRQVNAKVDGIEIPIGSTKEAGIVKLVTTTNSTSTTDAATPSAVKAAMDKANSATTLANSKAAKATTLAGYGITDGVKTSQISQDLGGNKSLIVSQNAITYALSSFNSKPVNVTSQRPANVNHYNNTGVPMFVYFNLGKGVEVGNNAPTLILDGLQIIGDWVSSYPIAYSLMILVPSGSYYKWIKNNGNATLILEYR